jgi:hypothetical protein
LLVVLIVTGASLLRPTRAEWASWLEKAVRSVLAICFVMALGASANAAAKRHYAKQRHAIVRPSQTLIPAYIAPNRARISVPGGRRTFHNDLPAYNDPSRFGGAMLPNQ